MIKLYGLRMSNYYSLTKALLLEKGLEFEEVKAPPAQDEDYLKRSPMGKMPSIEVDGQFMSESLAIFQYIEQLSCFVGQAGRVASHLSGVGACPGRGWLPDRGGLLPRRRRRC